MSSSNKALIGVAIKESAVLRATYVQTHHGGDAGIGFAEGVESVDGAQWAVAWCAIALHNGNIFVAHERVSLPLKLASKVADNSLLETDVEAFLQEQYPNLYDQLVEQAMKLMSL
jgi:hypothetical protein